MKLEEYLQKNDLTNREFAKRIGVHESAMSHYVCNLRRPRWDIMKKIRDATNGEVTPDDFMD